MQQILVIRRWLKLNILKLYGKSELLIFLKNTLINLIDRLNPQYAQAMNNLGNLLNNQKRYQEAKDLLKKAVGLQ